MNPSQKRPIVFAIRDFPSGCGTHTDVSSRFDLSAEKAFKNSSFDHSAEKAFKKSSFDLSAERGYKNSSFDLPAEKAFKNPRTSGVAVKKLCIEAPPQPNRTCVKRESGDQDHDPVVAVPEPNPKLSSRGQEPEIRNSDCDLTPREEVLEVLRLFKQVYRQLDRDKAARRGGDLFEATSRIDIKTLEVIENMRKQVNAEKRIGSVPGIEVGDEFQYKTELRVVGLHSRTMCGIDYMKIGDLRLATSIVASEGYGYNDTFHSGVMVYTGEGGNVISKENKTEDQKLVRGNLALANSKKHKKQVRVIRGEERLDRKGKRYVYDGLYMVEEYWVEKEVRGKSVYKFKLCRIPGQPPLT